jgi:hypothetical protein
MVFSAAAPAVEASREPAIEAKCLLHNFFSKKPASGGSRLSKHAVWRFDSHAMQ